MRYLDITEIRENISTADIVKKHYRTASVFKKYGIDYCCGVKLPLSIACEMKHLDTEQILNELKDAARVINVSGFLPFKDWKTDFLTDYIINVHHQYLKQYLPAIKEQLQHFVEEHKKRIPALADLEREFISMEKIIGPHLQKEEDVIFPYIRQIAHAYESKESYASLLVRTLRKPVEGIMQQEHNIMEERLYRIRSLTDNYTPPESNCTGHRLSFSMLRELDDDLVQHINLENNILFPRAIAMETELLQRQ
ncbi:MAG TPA: DUF542 domain-containing protein [Chitinophagaceae bacterium]|nr:DUF542 domain-containing protein [Chitinophagaceae bacterium]